MTTVAGNARDHTTKDQGSISRFHYVYLFHHVYPDLG
jgi:hypothetical protein